MRLAARQRCASVQHHIPQGNACRPWPVVVGGNSVSGCFCRQHVGKQRRRIACAAVLAEQKTEAPGLSLLKWLSDNGAPQAKLELRTLDVPAAGRPLDVTVAAQPLKAGEVALSVPEHLVVTLDRIFESEGLAEMLTAGKLSELACLALYLMYEKKVGKDSFWYQYIKELDRQRARGVQAVESPLLWSDEELVDLLQGSPVIAAVRQRLAGIEKEYQELDGVWFMAGSLFNNYPFDIPTEAFPFVRFKQAFAAVQASIVHLQGVPPARRFALVPMGPPLLPYSSTCKVGANGLPDSCVHVESPRCLYTGTDSMVEHNLLCQVVPSRLVSNTHSRQPYSHITFYAATCSLFEAQACTTRAPAMP
eukprot:GHRR01017515.1.p1 GENE.GHRR01017515.1~~GHRR01017515.1.p1  ORF type:complete len:363 (+),score=117.95 GHRR01017515.1:222-1310(+)